MHFQSFARLKDAVEHIHTDARDVDNLETYIAGQLIKKLEHILLSPSSKSVSAIRC